jgi:hypothetical protein
VDQNPSAWIEDHTVIGLQLDGMAEMGYIYAHDDRAVDITRAFGNVTMGALEPINDPIFRSGPPRSIITMGYSQFPLKLISTFRMA